MTAPLLQALRRMGVVEAAKPDAWEALMLMKNASPVPPRSSEVVWGFKFLLGNEQGDPAWFGRCGWGSPEAMERECKLLLALQADPATAKHTPEVRVELNGHRTIQVSRHLGHSAYHLAFRKLSPAEWARDVDEILVIAESVLAKLYINSPEIFPLDPLAYRRAALLQDCGVLRKNGLAAVSVDRLYRYVADNLDTLPVQLQHGDLWPTNVLQAQQQWWLIDYTECGLVWMPGYDLFMMLMNHPRGFSTSWIANDDQRSATDRWDEARKNIIRQFIKRHNMNKLQLSTALLYSLMHLAAYRMRDGVAKHLSAYLKDKLADVDRFLHSGNPLESIAP